MGHPYGIGYMGAIKPFYKMGHPYGIVKSENPVGMTHFVDPGSTGGKRTRQGQNPVGMTHFVGPGQNRRNERDRVKIP